MKSQRSLIKSMNACSNAVTRHSAAIHTIIKQQRDEGFTEDRQVRLRGYVEALNKNFHEYNAYSNTLLTN